MFQSEIRTSQINDLLEKVRNKNYSKYLLKLMIEKARSINNKTIDFEFPVTAIVGPNGGGKSTIAGAAAILYKDIAPAQFFAKSGAYDSSMQNWKIEYEAIDKSQKNNDTLRRTAKYHNLKWARNTLDRNVLIFGVIRTVPAAERKELRRCVSNNFHVSADRIENLSDIVANSVSSILDKDVSDFKHMKIDSHGNVTLLSGVNSQGDSFSEFHFGAGESSVIRMVLGLESAEDSSLVIIEEIENGLHPVATVRMVEYLIELAERKKIQTIFTTHSNDALAPLPSNAIWASVNGELYKGKLDIKSLRAISGQVNSDLVVFVEDEFAEIWVRTIFSFIEGVAFDAISFHPMKGDGTAVRVHKNHNVDPSVTQRSICIIDGDSEQSHSDANLIFRLPGDCPETKVYDDVLGNIDNISGELAVSLLKPYEYESKLKDIMESVRNTNRDPHLLYSQLGKKIGFISEARVKEALITIWCRINLDYIEMLHQKISDHLPKESDEREIKR
ncbi:ATP-dependent nuclease [Candidatus Symbiopectobacterium sp. NZEC135]|uniref:ATP-dependent nuclease n=1 Tax=Candidatus Symbiopectobacterium sp. NZEC135 TaxID=2820471 RepID=UPI002226351D|nr:AAA family ATPase [Candidatus Symbiopectobacterium sp. NZEC135]MCW2479154.1 AAA family ATPase [Candidatus Symbiopectobacterium sp. NZEC135]